MLRPADNTHAAARRFAKPSERERGMTAVNPIVCSWARAKVLMAKRIMRREDGTLDEVAYNNARMLRFTRREYATLDDFAAHSARLQA
jgi:hypothetical protein